AQPPRNRHQKDACRATGAVIGSWRGSNSQFPRESKSWGQCATSGIGKSVKKQQPWRQAVAPIGSGSATLNFRRFFTTLLHAYDNWNSRRSQTSYDENKIALHTGPGA